MAQAEGWVIKAKLVRSKKFNALNGDDFTQKIYCLMLACKDSYGMMPADPFSLKGALGPLDKTKTPQRFKAAVDKLASVGLVYQWDHQGDPWLYMMGHDEENRTNRRAKDPLVPRPDIDHMWLKTNKVWTNSGLTPESVGSNSNGSPDFVSHPPARAGSGKGKGKGDLDQEKEDGQFDIFWKAYPKKIGKGAARKSWEKIKPSVDLLGEILTAIDRQKRSPQWQKERGQFIPNPATWLNQERWSDSVNVEINQKWDL